MSQGDIKAGKLHHVWIVPLAFTLVFALNTPVSASSHAGFMPQFNYGQIAIAHVTLPPAATTGPKPSPSPHPSATAWSSGGAQVLGDSTTDNAPRMNFGVDEDLASLSTPQLDSALAGMKAMGVRWVRYDMNWSNIEYAGQGQYDWSNYDRVVSAVRSYGLHSLPILDYTPTWARISSCNDTQMCAPADPATYAQFAAAAVARYDGQGIQDWEIWNEPNITTFYLPAADPGQYTQMLKDAYVAIKGVDSGATVLTGGLAPSATGGGNMSPPDFLSGVYAAGGRGYFNAVADHPYTWPYLPNFYLPGAAWSQLTSLRNIMVANGDGGKQIWITEFGAPTNGPGSEATSGMTTAEGGDTFVSEGLQAEMVTEAVDDVWNYPWVGGFFWYNYIDSGTSMDTIQNFFGLLSADGTPKPAYYAYKEAISNP